MLSDEQKQKVKDYAISEAVDVVGKPIVHKIGDAMEHAKRPFLRKLVRFFRGEPK